jgi:hypothetical protein
VDTSDPTSTNGSLSSDGPPTTDETDRPSTDGPTTTDSDVSIPMPAADVPVVQYRVQGLFPVTPPFLANGWTTIYADGTVLAPFGGSAAAQPQVWPYEAGRVDPERVAELLAAAAAADLLGPPTPGEPPFPGNVSDPARTSVIITTADGTFAHHVDGLVGSETDPYRLAVQRFVGAISTLTMDGIRAGQQDGATSWYETEALDVLVVDVTDVSPPANGPTNVVDWTATGVDLSSMTTCTVLTDAGAIAFLKSNLAGPRYGQGDRVYRIASRIHPPGTTCGA